jgi:hypothetical protein
VFYYSQALAFLDCVYDAASRGVKYVMSLDMDEFITSDPSKYLKLNSHQILKWKNYKQVDSRNWKKWPQTGIGLGKTFMLSSDVIDASVHFPEKCVSGRCNRVVIGDAHLTHLRLTKNPKLLVMVVSTANRTHLWKKKQSVWKNTVIVIGDSNLSTEYEFVESLLYVKCADTYDALPEKVIRGFLAILNHSRFIDFTHVLKADDNSDYTNSNLTTITKSQDFVRHAYVGGKIWKGDGKRDYHKEKCPPWSYWKDKNYTGKYVHWPDGGVGYALRRDAIHCIKHRANLSEIAQNEIYEDLTIAKLLNECDIHPYHMTDAWILGHRAD